MWLILHHAGDAAAEWLAASLRATGAVPVYVMNDAELAGARSWMQRVSTRGAEAAWCDPRLGLMRDRDLRGVINRLVTVPAKMLASISPADRLHAFHELNAFLTSWLYGVRAPVFNRPTGRGLSGPVLHRSAWLMRASAVGLPTSAARVTSADSPERTRPEGLQTVFVVNGEVVSGYVPRSIAAGCERLATAARVALLAVELNPRDGWRVRDVPALPDLRLGGEALVTALHRCGRATTRRDPAPQTEARL